MTIRTTQAARRKSTPEERLRRDAQKQGKLALETLESIMRGEGQDSVRLAAAREVLDRGHGRPKLGGADATGEGEGLTVLVQRFTDADPNLEGDA